MIFIESTSQSSQITDYAKQVGDFLKSPSLLYAFIVLLGGYAIYRVLLIIFKKAIKKSRINKNIHAFLISSFRIVTLTLVIMTVAATAGIPVNTFLVVFSAFGLAISLAIQGFLSNLAGGLILLMAKPFSVGDWIEINNVVGVVQKTDILFTRILTFENKVVSFPNGTMSTAQISNYTMEKNRRFVFSFDVAADSNIDLVRKTIVDAVKKNDFYNKHFEPVVVVTDLSGYAISLSLRILVNNDDYWNFKFTLLENIKKDFDAAGIHFAPVFQAFLEQMKNQ